MNIRKIVLPVIVISLSAVLFFLASCAPNVIGSGKVVTETREVQDFDEVSLSGIGNLIVEQGNREALKIEAEDNIIPEILTEVNGSRLVISYKANTSIDPTKPINFFLTVRDLKAITTSGSGKVRNTNKLNTDRLDISTNGSGEINLRVKVKDLNSRISGSGRFEMSGKADNQTIDISGSAQYLARDLASKTCKVAISGLGKANVQVSEILDVDIRGSGEVGYIGNPQVNQHISGSGRIEKIKE